MDDSRAVDVKLKKARIKLRIGNYELKILKFDQSDKFNFNPFPSD